MKKYKFRILLERAKSLGLFLHLHVRPDGTTAYALSGQAEELFFASRKDVEAFLAKR